MLSVHSLSSLSYPHHTVPTHIPFTQSSDHTPPRSTAEAGEDCGYVYHSCVDPRPSPDRHPVDDHGSARRCDDLASRPARQRDCAPRHATRHLLRHPRPPQRETEAEGKTVARTLPRTAELVMSAQAPMCPLRPGPHGLPLACPRAADHTPHPACA